MIRVAVYNQSDAGVDEAARAAVRGVPADQALGLRLIALARAATAQHMTQAAQTTSAPLGTSQAAALVRGWEARP